MQLSEVNRELRNEITQPTEAQGEIRRATAEWQRTFDSIPDPVYILDKDFRFVKANKASAVMLKVKLEDLMGKTCYEIVHMGDKPWPNCPLQHALRDGKTYTAEMDDPNAGTTFLVTLAPILDEKGKLVGGVHIAKNITERKKREAEVQILNRELEQRLLELSTASKELEAFSYSVSHDLRAPLRAIDGFSQILLEDHREDLNKEGRRVLNVVRDNTRRMGDLIDDLLSFSRLGRKRMKKKSIDMYELTKNIVKELRNNSPEPKIKIKVNILPSAYADQALIRQVLINLLSNAIKFNGNEKSSLIEVGAKEKEDENIYYVKDNGVGFDMEYSDKLFGVFQRLHSQEEFKGTGVGLALVQRIIHRHQGRVWAEGKVNKGATFYFTIPLREERRKETNKENEK